MKNNNEEEYEPVDFKVNKDLKSIKAKGKNSNFNYIPLLGVFIFLLIIVIGLFAFLYRPWPASKGEQVELFIQRQQDTLEALQLQQEKLQSSMLFFRKGRGWISEEAQPYADSIQAQISAATRLIQALQDQTNTLDSLLSD